MNVVDVDELFDACRVLFGPQIKISMDFIRYLQPSGLKSAYRERALETHPDRAATLGLPEGDLKEQFKKVNLAYETLKPVVTLSGISITDRETSFRQSKGSSVKKRKPTPPDIRKTPATDSDRFYQGGLPPRELLIGQFLYYSGIISWQTLIRAVTWQRKKRGLIGEIAYEWGMLTTIDIREILNTRYIGERFGECALRKGHITQFELLALLGKQRMRHQPIGQFFVDQRIINPERLNRLLDRQKFHNMSVSGAFFDHVFHKGVFRGG